MKLLAIALLATTAAPAQRWVNPHLILKQNGVTVLRESDQVTIFVEGVPLTRSKCDCGDHFWRKGVEIIFDWTNAKAR